MKEIANTGVNVIAVIHQPRSGDHGHSLPSFLPFVLMLECVIGNCMPLVAGCGGNCRHDVFMMFNSVVMLANRGKVAYCGTPQNALEYFESFGFKCPAITNSADFFLDLLSNQDVKYEVIQEKDKGGKRDVDNGDDNDDGGGVGVGGDSSFKAEYVLPIQRVERISKRWELEEEELRRSEGREMVSEHVGTELTKHSKRKKRGFLLMVVLYMWRSMLVVYHDWFSYVLVCLIHAGAGAVMGVVFFDESIFVLPISPEYALRNLCPDAVKIQFCLLPAHDVVGLFSLFALMGIGVTGVAAGVKTFGDEKIVFLREASRGANVGAYVLARMLIDIPWIAMCSLSFVATFSTISSNQSGFYTLFVLIYLAELCIFGVIYILSLVMTQSNATLFGIILMLVWSTQNGWSTKIHEMGIMGTLSYARWFGEALFIAEVNPWGMSSESRDIITYFLDNYVYGYDIHHYSLDVWMLLAHALFFRLVAAATMIVKAW
jgi:hypothetical protein